MFLIGFVFKVGSLKILRVITNTKRINTEIYRLGGKAGYVTTKTTTSKKYKKIISAREFQEAHSLDSVRKC